MVAYYCKQYLGRRGNRWDIAINGKRWEVQERQVTSNWFFEYIKVFNKGGKIHSAADNLSTTADEDKFNRAA